MNGYLTKLAARSVGHTQTQPIKPRLASLFEPVAGLRLRSFKTLTAKKGSSLPDHLSQSDESNPLPAEVKVAGANPQLATGILEAPAQVTRTNSPANSPVEEASATVRPSFSARIRAQPGKADSAPAFDLNIGTKHPEQSIEARNDLISVGDEKELPSERATSVIETGMIESLFQSDPQSTAKAETRRVEPGSESRSITVKPEVTESITHLRVEAEMPEAASSVSITIGRVEVRAIMPSPPLPAAVNASSQRQPQPAQSLDEYLKQRNGDSG